MKQSVEKRKIASLVRQYKNEGYEVLMQPSTARMLPPFGNYRPDLVVQKGDETIVIEVVSSKTSKEKERAVEHFAEYAAKNKGVRFDIIVTNPRPTKRQRQNRDSILLDLLEKSLLKTLDETVDAQPQIFVVICCIIVENLLNGLAASDEELSERNRPLIALARRLREKEVISDSALNFVVQIWELRNAVMHGGAHPETSAQLLNIYQKTKSLLKIYKNRFDSNRLLSE